MHCLTHTNGNQSDAGSISFSAQPCRSTGLGFASAANSQRANKLKGLALP